MRFSHNFDCFPSQSNALAIHSAITQYRRWVAARMRVDPALKTPHVITSSIEHPSVAQCLRRYRGIDVTVVPWQEIPAGIASRVKRNTCLVTIMLANNETGIMLPIAQVARLLREDIQRTREGTGLPRVMLHTDASQCVGKVKVDVGVLGVDYVTIAGHKFYGPRIGALYVKEQRNGKLPVCPMFWGGGQESGYRAGTENTPMIAGLGQACQLVTDNFTTYEKHLKKIRTHFEKGLKRQFGSRVKINVLRPCALDDTGRCTSTLDNGQADTELVYARLPNTSSVAFDHPQITGRSLQRMCPNAHFSLGAACHGDEGGYSGSVLAAHGVCRHHAARTIRLSFGRETTVDEVDSVLGQLKLAVSMVEGGGEGRGKEAV